MATTVPSCGDGEHSIIEVQLADGNAADGSNPAGELQRTDSAACSTAASESQWTESSADDKVMWKQLKRLNNIVFYIELLEYSGNVIGTVAFLWATAVLLGAFCSLLSRLDFTIATIMVFLEGTRVFISKDTSDNQWLFGSTRAFRWDHFCFSSMYGFANLTAVGIGTGISSAPLDELVGSQIIAGILKVAILAITSLLLTRMRRSWFSTAVFPILVLAGAVGYLYGSFNKPEFKHVFYPKSLEIMTKMIMVAAMVGGIVIGIVVARLMYKIVKRMIARYGTPKRVFWFKMIVSLVLLCLPLLPAKYRYWNWNITMAGFLPIALDFPKAPTEQEQSNALLSGNWELLLKILDTIMPILLFWSVMFPLPGIPLKVSFYMLFSVISVVSIGNLQIPVAFLQILLSSLRLHSLLAGHHHSHRDYHPLPDGASPNLVPSIVIFFVLELCQGSSNILGVILGLISFSYRRSLVRVLGLTEEWGAKAVNLYYHQAFMTIKKNGLFPMEKSPPPSLDTFAVESLGSTSSEMQIVRLHVLDYYLQQVDSKSKRKLMAQIAKDAAGIVTKITETISHLITDEEILRSGNDTHALTGRLESLLPPIALNLKLKKQKQKQIRPSLSLCLNFLWRLAMAGGKMGTRFRKELSGNPILLHNLWRILDMEDCPQELWKPAMDVIKLLSLHEESTAKEIGSTHAVIPKLMAAFLARGDERDDKDGSRRKGAGEVLADLTITSSDNCRTILDMKAGAGRHDCINNLINMLQDDNYMSAAANLLHNLCTNSGDMLIEDLGAKECLKSALQKVMQNIIGNGNDKQLDVALCVASQIGYVIPKEDFAHVLAESNLAPNTDTAAAELVGKLVDTLKSNIEPNPDYPRLRRFLIGTVISLMELCPGYIEIFRTKGLEEALNKLKGTSSRLEKFKVFIEDEGMVPESTPMHKLVGEAKTKLRAA